jgi:hypothetical protein
VDYVSVDFDYCTERFEEGGWENVGGIVILGRRRLSVWFDFRSRCRPVWQVCNDDGVCRHDRYWRFRIQELKFGKFEVTIHTKIFWKLHSHNT